MKSSWKTRTARPKRSWSCVLGRRCPALVLELGRREERAPRPGRGRSSPRVVTWNESQSMSRTVAFRETTTLPWLTSPMTWPWRCAGVEGGGQVAGRPHQEGPGRPGTRPCGARAVERVDLPVGVHPRHQEADGAPRARDRAAGPCGQARERGELRRAELDHGLELPGGPLVRPAGVDLGHRAAATSAPRRRPPPRPGPGSGRGRLAPLEVEEGAHAYASASAFRPRPGEAASRGRASCRRPSAG